MSLMLSKMFLLMSVILCMPFFTLYERKLLSYIQKRKGPKKVSFVGILQPVFDGMKLMMKESSFPVFSNFFFFFFFSLMTFLVMVFLWMIYPQYFTKMNIKYLFLLILILTSLNVYMLMGSGWSSNSKYSLLGSVRGAAQAMSYEVSLVFMVLMPGFIKLSYNLWNYYKKSTFWVMYMKFFIFLIWLIVILAETNRSPFDFAEGESELVSGFKTEYSSLVFAFLFLGEYGSMLWMSSMSVLMFMKFHWLMTFIFSLMLVFFFVWTRGSLPRFRYDMLMVTAWKMILPMSLCFMSIFHMVL